MAKQPTRREALDKDLKLYGRSEFMWSSQRDNPIRRSLEAVFPNKPVHVPMKNRITDKLMADPGGIGDKLKD
jgi:hypothetical protein